MTETQIYLVIICALAAFCVAHMILKGDWLKGDDQAWGSIYMALLPSVSLGSALYYGWSWLEAAGLAAASLAGLAAAVVHVGIRPEYVAWRKRYESFWKG